MWGATAAAAAGAFAAAALRRKKEREQQIEDYYRSRPVKIEAEGKGGRLTGGQIAKAYQAAMSNSKKKLQENGLSAAEADTFVKKARANGSIASVQKAVADYAIQKEQKEREQAERAAAYRAWRVEEATYIPPSEPAPDLQAGLQALYEGRKAGEAEAAQKSVWQRAGEAVTTTAQKVTNAVSSVVGTLSLPRTGSYKLAAPALQDDGPGPFDHIIESIKNWWTATSSTDHPSTELCLIAIRYLHEQVSNVE